MEGNVCTNDELTIGMEVVMSRTVIFLCCNPLEMEHYNSSATVLCTPVAAMADEARGISGATSNKQSLVFFQFAPRVWLKRECTDCFESALPCTILFAYLFLEERALASGRSFSRTILNLVMALYTIGTVV